MGRSNSDYDNVGHQISRSTDYSGSQTHSIKGFTFNSTSKISYIGGSKEHENQPPYYVVLHMFFLEL
jgi:hypothetical protein